MFLSMVCPLKMHPLEVIRVFDTLYMIFYSWQQCPTPVSEHRRLCQDSFQGVPEASSGIRNLLRQ